MVCTSLAESLSSRSELSDLRRRLRQRDEDVARLERRAEAVGRRCADVSEVVGRYFADCRRAAEAGCANCAIPAPAKITRSVGLMVRPVSFFLKKRLFGTLRSL